MHSAQQSPFFSVIVPTFNRAGIIDRCVQTVLDQTFTDWELLIIDDGSTDDTRAVMEKHKHNDKIRFYAFDNRGANIARNKGVELSKGKFLAFLDSDDSWSANRLHCVQAKIREEQLPEQIVFFTDFVTGSKHKNIFSKKLFESSQVGKILLSHNFFGGTSNLIVASKALKQVNAFDESLPSCQDHDMYLRLFHHFEFCHVPGCSVIYNTESGNRISRKSKRKLIGHILFYRKHKSLMGPLSKLLVKKKIALISYSTRSFSFFRYAYAWGLVKILRKIYRCRDERELYFYDIPMFNKTDTGK